MKYIVNCLLALCVCGLTRYRLERRLQLILREVGERHALSQPRCLRFGDPRPRLALRRW